jgi:hypothetical protein
MTASRVPTVADAPRPRRRRALAAGAAVVLVAGLAALAAGSASLAAPLHVLTYVVLIPAALLA